MPGPGAFAALQFNSEVIGPAVVLGVAAAGLYGLLAVSVVLTYRVSRTIGFVQGGIALFGMYLYWSLTMPGEQIGSDPQLGRGPGALVVVMTGAAIGLAYGATVTAKLSDWPRVRLTIYSLGWLLALATAIIWLFSGRFSRLQGFPVPSLFGTARYRIFGAMVSIHQVATLLLLVLLVAVLSLVLLRTRAGIFIRAIADDPEAGRLVGIPLHRVGTAVYCASGALAGLAGVLMASTIGVDFFLGLVVFLRALTVSVLGGFRSLPLALAGCVVLGFGETALSAELFGSLSGGEREVLIMSVLFGLVFIINRFRPIRVIEASA